MSIEFWFLIYKFLSNTVVLCGAISDTVTGSPVPILPCFTGIFVFLIMCTDHCSHICVPFRDICFFFLQHLVQNSLHWLSNQFFFLFFNFCFPCGFLLFIRLCYLIVFKSLNWSGFKSLNWSGIGIGNWKLQGTFAPPAEYIEFVLAFLPLGSLFINSFNEFGDSHWALLTLVFIWETTLQSRIKTDEIRVISCV